MKHSLLILTLLFGSICILPYSKGNYLTTEHSTKSISGSTQLSLDQELCSYLTSTKIWNREEVVRSGGNIEEFPYEPEDVKELRFECKMDRAYTPIREYTRKGNENFVLSTIYKVSGPKRLIAEVVEVLIV
jgi:hypothetical protein